LVPLGVLAAPDTSSASGAAYPGSRSSRPPATTTTEVREPLTARSKAASASASVIECATIDALRRASSRARVADQVSQAALVQRVPSSFAASALRATAVSAALAAE
jgi:hypothetical protein